MVKKRMAGNEKKLTSRMRNKKKTCPAPSLGKDYSINHTTLHFSPSLQKVMTAIFWRWDFTLYPFRGCRTRRMARWIPATWKNPRFGECARLVIGRRKVLSKRAWYQVHRTPNTPRGTMRSTPYIQRLPVEWCVMMYRVWNIFGQLYADM